MQPTNTAIHLLAILTAVTAIGCVDATWGEDEPTAVRRQEIMGGTVDNDNTSVVGILIDLGGGQSLCSGTLIAPNLVLTAQHCVAQLSSEYVICGQTPFGAQFPPSTFLVTTQTNFPQAASGYHEVEAVHVPPGTNDTCGYDIALLQLRNNITTTDPIVPRIDVPLTEGERYTAIGYGHIGNGTGAGTRRQLGNREVLCAPGQCPANQGITATEFAGTDGTCQGDSGGAAIDAQGRVVGALSRGPDGCLGAVYSSTRAWASWLRNIGELAANEGGYAAPLWVSQGISEVPANDPDLDGILDPNDNCPGIANPQQLDLDSDGFGDDCDDDMDGDGIANGPDNCPLYANPQQLDNDSDTFGDICDTDDDNDGVMDEVDNCQFLPNASQDNICVGNPGSGQTATPSQPDTGSPYQPGGTYDEDGVSIVVRPDPIHATGEMSCSLGAGSPANFGGLVLFVLGLVGRRRRR